MLTDYHFDLGNSTSGPIGACARVIAQSEAEAVVILREALALAMPSLEINVPLYSPAGERLDKVQRDNIGLVYLNVYLNPDHIVPKDIDDSDPV